MTLAHYRTIFRGGPNAYSHSVQSEVILDDLFRDALAHRPHFTLAISKQSKSMSPRTKKAGPFIVGRGRF